MNYQKTVLIIFFLTSLTLASQKSPQQLAGDDLIFASSFELTPKANIVSVTTDESGSNYIFNVGILSPDISCVQYADWWEILDVNGLVYRRILGHSHVNQQPFVRSSVPLDISPTEIFWIRAHMNNGGYGGEMFTGSVNQGFILIPYDNRWSANVEFEPPQVTSCAH